MGYSFLGIIHHKRVVQIYTCRRKLSSENLFFSFLKLSSVLHEAVRKINRFPLTKRLAIILNDAHVVDIKNESAIVDFTANFVLVSSHTAII